jgi:ATP/maltotriose-dependent transcriptional regulator MalT
MSKTAQNGTKSRRRPRSCKPGVLKEEAARLHVEGVSNRQIAKRLHVKPHTVPAMLADSKFLRTYRRTLKEQIESISQAYREALMAVDPETGLIVVEAIARAVVARALKGDVRAAAEIMDRTEGKARQVVDVTADVNWTRSLSDEELAQAIQDRIEQIAQVAGADKHPRD